MTGSPLIKEEWDGFTNDWFMKANIILSKPAVSRGRHNHFQQNYRACPKNKWRWNQEFLCSPYSNPVYLSACKYDNLLSKMTKMQFKSATVFMLYFYDRYGQMIVLREMPRLYMQFREISSILPRHSNHVHIVLLGAPNVKNTVLNYLQKKVQLWLRNICTYKRRLTIVQLTITSRESPWLLARVM